MPIFLDQTCSLRTGFRVPQVYNIAHSPNLIKQCIVFFPITNVWVPSLLHLLNCNLLSFERLVLFSLLFFSGKSAEQGNIIWQLTFSSRSMVGCKSRPKSMKVHSIPSRWYSACSKINMVWLNNCCSFSFV